MFLVIPCDSLSTMVKHLGLTGCPVEWLWWSIGDGSLKCSLSLSQNVLPYLSIYSSGQLMCGYLNLYDSTLLMFGVPVLGSNEEGFYGVGTLKMYMDPQVVVCPFEPFP